MVLAGACSQATQVVPAVDTSARATSLAGTAVAAFGTATFTPSPTKTSVPKAVVSSQGTSLMPQEDGSTLFTDHKAGIQLTFQVGWLAMRVGEKEYYSALEKPFMQNPAFQDLFGVLNNADPKVLRLLALDAREGHMPGDLVTDISVVFLEGDDQSLEQKEKARRAKTNLCLDYKFILSSYSETDNGVRILVMEESCGVPKSAVYYRDVYFNVPTGKIHLKFETNFDYKDAALTDFEQVLNGLTMLNP